MMALDADGDGQLSPEEIKNAPEALKRLDRNGDGKVHLRDPARPVIPREA